MSQSSRGEITWKSQVLRIGSEAAHLSTSVYPHHFQLKTTPTCGNFCTVDPQDPVRRVGSEEDGYLHVLFAQRNSSNPILNDTVRSIYVVIYIH